MPDPTGDSKGVNYSRGDEGARRLWRTQIGRANPWEHRAGDGAPEQEPPRGEPEAAGEPPLPAVPRTPDHLRLKGDPPPDNPFERLLGNPRGT